MVGWSKCWKVCGPTEKSRSEGGERYGFCTIWNGGCEHVLVWFSALVFGIWGLFRKGKMLQDEISSFAQPCVVLRGYVHLNDVRGELRRGRFSYSDS